MGSSGCLWRLWGDEAVQPLSSPEPAVLCIRRLQAGRRKKMMRPKARAVAQPPATATTRLPWDSAVSPVHSGVWVMASPETASLGTG